MKSGYCYLILFIAVLKGTYFSQINKINPKHDSLFFNYAYWNGLADKKHLSPTEKQEFIEGHRNEFEAHAAHPHVDEKEIVWVNAPEQAKKGFSQNTINAGPCTNIDFESGTTFGWVRSTGFNPLFNAAGCCPNANGDQNIMTGGTDPYGGFPRVYPGGGSFSLRLGSTAVGGIADRISQTFFVTAANANFTYRYALVLNDGGHNTAQQPRFTSEIIDTLGNAVPCTFYQASAGSNTFGLVTSTLGAPNNNSPVSYKTWTDVALDLTPNIGQNVTLRFTVYDCGPSGHFAYAYIDGSCTNFATEVSDTTCPNVPITMCAPSGFSTTTWNGPGTVNNTNRCISVSAPGIYTCATVLVPGCPGPTFTHTLTNLPNPVLTFTPVSGGPCSTQYTFNSSSSVSGGSITSYLWSFGDGTFSNLTNPTHNYATSGTYAVKFKAITNRGCADSVITTITVFPFPNLSFSPPSNCINTVIQFTNTSTIGVGSIAGYTWSLGNGPTSNLVNPTNSYTANGTYTIVLDAISNQGCPASLTRTLGIFPPPILSFSANPLCDINGTSFSPSTSTAIASGSLASYLWDFGDGGTSTLSTPVHIYATSGTYTVNFSAVSNHNCPAATSNTFLISPSPTVAFATASINACSNNFTFTNNSGISSGPISYTWDFGGGNTSNSSAASLTYTFPGIGNYTVSLVGISNMGCTDTSYQFISIYPFPVVNFSVPASCENAIFTVSTTAVTGSVTSYNWNFGDPSSGASNTSTLQNPTHFYSTTNTYTITLNILSNLNCPSSTVVPITVFPNPNAIFSYTNLNNCSLPYTYANSSTVSSIGASSIVAFNWNFGAAGTSTLPSPGTISFPGNGTYTVSLIARTNHNCSDTMTQVIKVHPFPQLAFTVNPVCQNVAVPFIATSSISAIPGPGSSISSYTWSFGDNSFYGFLNPPPHSYTIDGTYPVQLSATSNMGCVSSVTKTLVIYPVPSVNFTTTSNMCLGNTTAFTSTSSVASTGTIYTYNWTFGDGTNGSNPNISHTYTSSGNYAVTFSVATGDECMAILTKTITVHPLPVVSFSVNNGCLNTQSIFNTTGTISPGSISSYSWNFGDGNSAAGQNPLYTYTLDGTYTPTVTATSIMGCTTSVSNSLVVHPLPTLIFSAPSLCANLPVAFANTSSISIGGITSYTWTLEPTVFSNSITPVYTYSNAGVKTITLVAVSNQSCLASGTTNFSVHPYPNSTLTTINSSCINDLVSFNPNLSISSGSIPSTTINFGDAASSTFTNVLSLTVAHTYSAYNTYTVSIIANSNHNCVSTFTNTVKIFPKPFVNFTSNNFCHKDSTAFTNISIIPTGSISSHAWFFSDGSSTSTLSSLKFKFTAPGVYSVSLTEYSYPDAGLTCSLSTTKQVTINPLPVPLFTVSSVCQGTANLFTNLTPTNGIIGWTWDFDNNGTADNSLQNTSHVYPTSGTYTAALIAQNNFNCTDTVRMPVVVFTNPVPVFTANAVCLGNVTSFTNQTLPVPNASLTFNWAFGNGNTSTLQATNNTNVYLADGSFTSTLLVTSSQGCSKSGTINVTVHPLPILTFSAADVCENTPVQFVNTSTITLGSIASYTWNFADGNYSLTPAPMHLYNGSVIKTVTLTAISNQGCTSIGTTTASVHPYPTATIVPVKTCVNSQISFNPNISITGNNSVPNVTVNFGDATSLTFTNGLTPPLTHTYINSNTYSVSLVALSSNNCSASFTQTFVIYPRPIVNFTVSNTCATDLSQFVNTSSIISGSITGHSWSFPPSALSPTIANPAISYSNAGVYAVSLTEISEPENGMFCNATAVQQITINPIPAPSFTVNNVCLGATTSFTNTTPTSSTQTITGWTWDFDNNSSPDSYLPSPNYNYPNSGTVTVMLTAKNNFNCSNTFSLPVVVNPNPSPSFISNTVCLGGITTFTNQTPPVNGTSPTFSWTTNSTTFSTIQDPFFTYNTHGTFPVVLTASTAAGCVKQFTAPVNVYELPQVGFISNNACFNSVTTFTNLTGIGTGTITKWWWDFDNNNTWDDSTTFNANLTFTTSGSFNTTLRAISDRGCLSRVTNSVLVRPLPVPDFSVTNVKVCIDDPISGVDLSTSSGGSITAYNWDFNNDGVTDREDKNPVYTYSLSGYFDVSLKAITEFGCLAVKTKSVFINPKASPLFNSTNQFGCPELCVNMNDVSKIPPGYSIVNREWDFGDGDPIQKKAPAQVTHCYQSGIYNVKLTITTDSGCVSELKIPGFVQVADPPTASFETEPTEIDENQPVLDVRSTAKDAMSSKFYISDGTNYSGTSFTHNFKKFDGKTRPMIVQIVSNGAGCVDTLFKLIDIKPAYVIYVPDVFTPNNDGLNDKFQPKGVGIIKISMQIFDRWGHVVYSTNDMNQPWDGTLRRGGEMAKQDVYVWKAIVTDVFNKTHNLAGKVTVLR